MAEYITQSTNSIYQDIHEQLVLGKKITLVNSTINYSSYKTSWYRFAKGSKLLVGERRLKCSLDVPADRITIWLEKPTQQKAAYQIVEIGEQK